MGGAQKSMRIVIVAIILMLVPLSFTNVSSPNELEQRVVYEIGTNSNYTLEALTDISSSYRAKHVTFHNHTNGIDIAYFDDLLNVWKVEQNIGGEWTSNIYASQKSTANHFEFVVTSFGIFNVQQTTVLASANCSGSYQMEYSFEVYNLSNNSGSPLEFAICGIGQTGYSINSIYANTNPNGAATVSDDFFSFAFTTCYKVNGNSGPLYKDHIVSISANGSSQNHSFSGRFGLGGYTNCGFVAPNVISAGNISCISAKGHQNGGWTGWGDTLRIDCVNHHNNSLNFGDRFCYGQYGYCSSERFYSINQEQ